MVAVPHRCLFICEGLAEALPPPPPAADGRSVGERRCGIPSGRRLSSPFLSLMGLHPPPPPPQTPSSSSSSASWLRGGGMAAGGGGTMQPPIIAAFLAYVIVIVPPPCRSNPRCLSCCAPAGLPALPSPPLPHHAHHQLVPTGGCCKGHGGHNNIGPPSLLDPLNYININKHIICLFFCRCAAVTKAK